MFERFTDSVRRVIVLAEEEARILNHNFVGTEHLLLGLIHEGDGVAAKVLESLNISLDAVREQVQENIGKGQQEPSGHIPFTPHAKKVLELSLREVLQLGHYYIGTEHILLSLIREGEGEAAQVLVKLGADVGNIRQRLVEHLPAKIDAEAREIPEGSTLLDKFGRNLTALAHERMLDPVIGRAPEIERIMQVLLRHTKNNPVLIGEHGVGKTSVVEGLAQTIALGNVPRSFLDKIIYSIELKKEPNLINSDEVNVILAENLEALIKEMHLRKDIILYIDDIHLIIGQEKLGEEIEIIAELRDMISSGHLQLISTSTEDEYREYIGMDTELDPVFLPVEIGEPSEELTALILRRHRESLEAYHGLAISDDALRTAALLTNIYDTERYQPGKSIDLLDEACARMKIQLTSYPTRIKELDIEIAEVRLQKEAAIDAQDFEGAASLRDEESKLIATRDKEEWVWRRDEMHEIGELTENSVAETLSERMGITVNQLRLKKTLKYNEAAVAANQRDGSPSIFRLLSDRPVADEHEDLMNISATAGTIASVLNESISSSPFVMAIDGGWGSGKSTLLNHIYNSLPKNENTKIIRFNAWTSQGDQALEGLIKSVLIELEPRTLRKLARTMMNKRKTIAWIKIAVTIILRFLGAGKILDEIWDRAQLDAKGRNELRATIIDTITDWTRKGPAGTNGRSLVILVDDLDRCSESVIIKVCEAVKLYLDAPGMIFVLACDMRVLNQSAFELNYISEATVYLEKIVQVVHRIKAPTETQLRNLINGYAEQAGISELVDESIVEILVTQADRNPRRIKRIINSFILAIRLDQSWDSAELGNAQLVRVIILQHLYPTFFEFFMNDQATIDPIGEFIEYASVVEHVSNPPNKTHLWWSTTSRFLRRHKIAPPTKLENDSAVERLNLLVKKAEADLPDDYPALARNESFVDFLRGFGDHNSRVSVRTHLLSNPIQFGEGLEATGP